MPVSKINSYVPTQTHNLPALGTQPDCCIMASIKKVFELIGTLFKKIFSCCFSSDETKNTPSLPSNQK